MNQACLLVICDTNLLFRKVDWALELITDNQIANPDPSWSALIESCLTPETTDRMDLLGAPYPDVRPGAPYNIQINSIILRSTIQYRIIDSGSVVEISIYRTWQGRNTKIEPVVETSVSMFHQDWEWQLAETTDVRDWEGDEFLSPLFSNGTRDKTGIEQFFHEVGEIQSDLSDVCRNMFDTCEWLATSA